MFSYMKQLCGGRAVRVPQNNTHIRRILQCGIDHGLAEEHVSAARTPQHPLERRQALPKDDSGHKAALLLLFFLRAHVKTERD